MGTAPAALSSVSGVLLAVDGIDRKLNQADVPPGDVSYRQLEGRAIATGAVPTQVSVDGPYVFVTNAESGTLQIVRRGNPDGDAGVALSTVQEFLLGANTFPQGFTKLGNSLWIPLYGGVGAAAADAGQRLVEINVSSPTSPRPVSEVSFKDLDLLPFDGGRPVARPWAVTSRDGFVFVALNNLNPETYEPQGPGLVVKVDPVTKVRTVLNLGAERCLNPVWLAPFATGLAVSCGGRAKYAGQDFVLERIEHAGVVLLDAKDQVISVWEPKVSCPDAGSCPLFLPGRFGVKDNVLFLADQNAGRLAVLEYRDGGFVERRGPAMHDAVLACPLSATSKVSNVSDVYVP
jgi:hypothetical protein